MKPIKLYALVLFIFLAELTLIFFMYSKASNTFNSRMDRDISILEQGLGKIGESPEKIRYQVYALQSVTSHVNSYIQKTYFIATLLAMFSVYFPLLVGKYFSQTPKIENKE